jgi:hypothetical protein
MSHRPLRATFGRTDDGRVTVDVVGLGGSFVPEEADDDDDDDKDGGDDDKGDKKAAKVVEVKRLV